MITRSITFIETIPTNLWIVSDYSIHPIEQRVTTLIYNEILSIIEEFREAGLIIN